MLGKSQSLPCVSKALVIAEYIVMQNKYVLYLAYSSVNEKQ